MILYSRQDHAEEQDGWLKALWNKRAIYLNEKYKREKVFRLQLFPIRFCTGCHICYLFHCLFLHLILKLLYIRRRKEFYYADHGIFSVHHYILSFILLLFVFLWDKMHDMTGWGIWDWLIFCITIIAWPVYLFLAMKRFYRQNGIKTFIKFLLLNITGLYYCLSCWFSFSFFLFFNFNV